MTEYTDITGESESNASGKAYWRSLEQRADAPDFLDWVTERFPRSMRSLLEGDGGIDRRRFLRLMAASLGLAGLTTGCRRPELKALPYAKSPEDVVPGLPSYYASALPRRGSAVAVLVESHEGRPTKIEGNPKHPDSEGISDASAQASVLDLYDPDRSRTVLRAGTSSSWSAYDAFAEAHFATVRTRKGRGLCVLTGNVVSPSLELLRRHFRAVMPEARWCVHEPVGDENIRAGALTAFGVPLLPRYRFRGAVVIVTLDADILGLEDDGGRHVREFAGARRPGASGEPLNRLYAIESQYTLTGGMADHRLRLASTHVGDYTRLLAREVLSATSAPGKEQAALLARLASFRPSTEIDVRRVREVAADLLRHRGKSVVVAGRRQPELVHALAHAMNVSLGNVGTTVELRRGRDTSRELALPELAKAISQSEVETLVIIGGNPAYDAPADLDFGALLSKVPITIRLGLHADETSSHASWHLPAAHDLESWGDARTSDGTVVPVQPMIEPLFGGRTALEVLGRISEFQTTSAYEIVRLAFAASTGVAGADLESAWRRFLNDGLLAGSDIPAVSLGVRWGAVADAEVAAAAGPRHGRLSSSNLELVLHPDARIDDGRFANNGWLQEVPDPITKLTWDNAAVFSPATAKELGLATGDLITLKRDGRSLEAAAFVLPGQADHSVALPLGYGRTAAGRVGNGVGFNAYTLRTTAAPDIAVGLSVTKTGRTHRLACTQDHFSMEGRDLVREITLDDLLNPKPSEASRNPVVDIDIQERPALNGEHQWGMVIDLNACVGCNACTVACQSENNIPIVGKDEVIRGREMHWIRIDRYFAGKTENPRLIHQPVACMHCESAPCEVVCPVNATVHSDEGLNVQVYSRCIGTRYCLNNCPYKVRRFNFFDYNERPLDQLRLGPLAPKGMEETLKMQKNPDVTVRMRGVMEKCTYCVQRIERGKIGARVEAGASGHTAVPDGTIVPACAQACPARAIVFGDISDPHSQVSRLKADTRHYSLLGELNTRPRTTYLARVQNPNPKMAAPPGGGV